MRCPPALVLLAAGARFAAGFAGAWVASGGDAENAIGAAMRTRADHEPRTASGFLRDSIPEDEARGAAIAGLVRVTRLSEPEAAGA